MISLFIELIFANNVNVNNPTDYQSINSEVVKVTITFGSYSPLQKLDTFLKTLVVRTRQLGITGIGKTTRPLKYIITYTPRKCDKKYLRRIKKNLEELEKRT